MGGLVRKMILHGLISFLVIGLVFSLSPKVFIGDTDTARNYLSTIVSCLSTIFALCISITLVAIQLTASRYTHRVLDLFLKLPFNISLTLFYFVTIIQSLFLLSHITEPIHETLPAYLQPQMNADMVLVVLCFAILVVYMYAVMQLLKPERIVAEIERECWAAVRRKREREAVDKVEQICDIAKRAAGDMDSTTGMVAVAALEKIAGEGSESMWASVTKQYVEIATISAKEREGGLLGAVLFSLYSIGEQAIKADRLKEARDVIHAFERIVRTGLVGQQLFYFIEEAVSAIFRLAILAARLKMPGACALDSSFAEKTFETIRKIGEEVLAREVEGGSYVSRLMLSERFGELLRGVLQQADSSFTEGGWRLVVAYAHLVKILMAKSDIRDIVPITIWIRDELLDDKREERVEGVLLPLSVLLAALAAYEKRPDVERLLVHAVASTHAFPARVSEWLKEKPMLVRGLFDYVDSAEYLEHVRREWQVFRAGLLVGH